MSEMHKAELLGAVYHYYIPGPGILFDVDESDSEWSWQQVGGRRNKHGYGFKTREEAVRDAERILQQEKKGPKAA